MRSRSRNASLALILCLATCSVAAAPPSAAPPSEAPPAKLEPIDLVASPERDAEIERRLQTIFAQLDRLQEIEVEVASGVVRLRGQALEREAAEQAERIAARVEGVVTVENDIEQIRSIERRLRPLIDRLRERGVEILLFIPQFLAGLLVIGGFWLLARALGRVAERRRKTKHNPFVREVVGQVVSTAVLVLGVVLALEVMGASTLIGAVLGTAGLVGLALGFAFRDMAENYIASILLSVRQPFAPDDFVEVAGQSGLVVRLTSRATVLRTLAGNHVRIPNSTVFKSVIINYTRNPQRRFSFEVGVAVEADLAQVQELARATMLATPGVLADPGPACLVDRFGDSAMIVSIGAWIDQREADWFKVNSEARRRIKVAFEQAGIEVPEPIYQVRTRALEPEALEREPSGERLEQATDVRPDQHVAKQVAEEREHEADLLRHDAQTE
ncbi:MAG TPA: mechanosensitive ion channel family protein [Enhygromyxa sp.]|nr:mechanosensitive ion channel family protein [Enhygromyxa sp.]